MESIYNYLKSLNIVFQEEIPEKGSYIMQDGLFLNLEASKEILNGHGWHSDIDQFMKEEYGVIPYYLLKSDNAIQCQLGYDKMQAQINIPKVNLTKEQFDSLELFINVLITEKKTFNIFISDFENKHTERLKSSDFENITVKDVINEIKNKL